MGAHLHTRKVELLSWSVIVLAVLALAWMNWQRRSGGGEFPERPITIICPFAAGGGTDLLARRLAYDAEQRFGRPVLVNNITGGGGAIGHAAGRIAPPDGHTVLLATFEMVSLPIQGLAPFTHEDYDLLLLLNMDPAALAVREDHPAQSLSEFVELAQSGKPPSIGNSGSGAVWHLAAGLLCEKADMEAVHVPFNGASQAITSLLGAHVDAVVVSAAELKTYASAGQLRMLGVMSEERLPAFPEIPTCAEQELQVVFGTWRGLVLPKGVPGDRRDALRAVFRDAVASEAFDQFAAQSGMNIHVADEEGFRALARRQAEEVAVIMKQLGLTR
jgi:tripartite-type tricarboxylate transporter receptor subunit TctC